MRSLTIKNLEDHFQPLKDKYWVLLYGSRADETHSPFSDYDIAIITQSYQQTHNNQVQWDVLKFFIQGLDIRVFELLPLTVQISIIRNYRVIWGDPLEISEYLYVYRKKWNDCKHRILSNQFSHYTERLKYWQTRSVL